MNLSSFGRRILQLADAATFYSVTNLFSTANTWTAIQTFSANPSVTGGAISFPATQVPSAGANDLDDYREATYTPVASSSAGAITTQSGAGSYTKIGRQVTFNARVVLTNVGTGSGFLFVSVPFASASGTVLEWIIPGAERNLTNKVLYGILGVGNTNMIVLDYVGSAALFVNGYVITLSGSYNA